MTMPENATIARRPFSSSLSAMMSLFFWSNLADRPGVNMEVGAVLDNDHNDRKKRKEVSTRVRKIRTKIMR